MVQQEMMDLHREMNLRQRVQRPREMMVAQVKNLLQKVLMRANPLQTLLQMDRLQEMDLLLAILLLQEMQLLPQILLRLQVLLPLMRRRLQHLQQRQLLLLQMRPRLLPPRWNHLLHRLCRLKKLQLQLIVQMLEIKH